MMKLFEKFNERKFQKEWNEKGSDYAQKINEMVEVGERIGWKNWKGKEPVDEREYLSEKIISKLRKANENSQIEEFRNNFPPSNQPIFKHIKENGQIIEQLQFIEDEKIILVLRAVYENQRKTYLLDNDKVIELDQDICGIGKSKQNEIFAIAKSNELSITQGWKGELISKIPFQEIEGEYITNIIPFNDGSRVLIVSSLGIYLVDEERELLIHPDFEEEDWKSDAAMANADLSNDNKFIVVGDQDSHHIIMTSDGNELNKLVQYSEYPHFCLFSKDDEQIITNSCHLYNGFTVGFERQKVTGEIELQDFDNQQVIEIDDQMRVYAGVATKNGYILGDAYGYIKEWNKKGEKQWRHYVGHNITGMTISKDGKILWVSTNAGMIHKLLLGKGHRDNHTIGNGNHYEEFRLIFWKNEPKPLLW